MASRFAVIVGLIVYVLLLSFLAVPLSTEFYRARLCGLLKLKREAPFVLEPPAPPVARPPLPRRSPLLPPRRSSRAIQAPTQGNHMKTLPGIGLSNVQQVYSGPEGDLWELIMGQQIHIGGFASSMDLAEKAGIGEGLRGVDLCCCNGAGMRFLIRFRKAAHMTGVDATPKVLGPGARTLRRRGDGGSDPRSSKRTSAARGCRAARWISSGARTPGATSSTSRR